jgi:hypothetical protein
VLHLLEALQLLQIKMPGGGKAEARRLSFRALDIEQIGHVYEGLLDHTAKRAAEPFVGLAGSRNNEPEIPLAELEQFLAKGEAELIKYLKETTGKQEKAILKLLKVELDTPDIARFRTVCQGDDALWKRVQPFAGFIRVDNFGYPVVILPGNVFVTAGTDRRAGGVHYTPRSLTEPIVQYTLEPMVYVGPAEGNPKEEWKLKPARELLDLKICDMACGSGAFLVQAARYMAERILEAWEEAKQANPNTPGITPEGLPSTGKTNESLIPEDAAERKTYAMRLVAQRCLYGVDKNPLAVEMAKLSLWLLTVAKDKPFEFLDHSIRSGDSLVGLHSVDQLRHYSLKPEAADAVLFKGPLDGAVDEAINLRLKLEDLPANTVEDVERQEKLLKEANEKIARLRCAADLLVAAEFWGGNAKDKLERVRHNAVRSGYYIEKGPTEEFEQVAAKDRQGQSMFHWCLEFPEVIVKRGGFDAFVGNPPFVGGKMISSHNGVHYRSFLQEILTDGVKGHADLCAYFFIRAVSLLNDEKTFGLLSTNTIAQGDTREVGLDRILNGGSHLFRAVSSKPWPGMASVKVSEVWLFKGKWKGNYTLDDVSVKNISSYLSDSSESETPFRLSANSSKAFIGTVIYGDGFLLSPEDGERIIESDERNSDTVIPYLSGVDVNTSPTHSPSRMVIDFGERTFVEARLYPLCFEQVERLVKPSRMNAPEKQMREKWWLFQRRRPELYQTIESSKQVICKARHSPNCAFAFTASNMVFQDSLAVIATDQYTEFAALSSTIHEVWAWHNGSTLGDSTLRYTPSDCFETFSFPHQTNKLESSGQTYHEHRLHIMLDRQEGLTKTYNRFHNPDEKSADIQKLRDLHAEMDQAVASAYGWSNLKLDHGFHETKQGMRFTISEPARREVLQRLLKLNHERYAEEVKQGLHDKKKGSAKKAAPKKKATGKPAKDGATLFDQVEEDA